MSRFCTACGALARDGAHFCGACGGTLDLEVRDATGRDGADAPWTNDTPEAPDAFARPPRRLRRLLLSVMGLVLIAGVAAGTALLVAGGEEPQTVREVVNVIERVTPAASPTPDPTEEALTDAEIAQRFGDAVFRVEVEGCGSAASGSGFAIDASTVVTNWHVVAIDPTPLLVDRHGNEVAGEVIGMTSRPDVAVIKVSEPLSTTLEWAPTDELVEGQRLVSLGYPVPDTDFTVTPGAIMSFQRRDGVREAIRYDGPLDKGNSGGPSLDRRGRVVGVVTEMALNERGFQTVPLVFTHDTLGDTVEELAEGTSTVEADCQADGPAPLPEEWEWEPAEVHTYGDDDTLDALWDACEDGDLAACDELYWQSPAGSDYEWFGGTCGDREPGWGSCELTAAELEEPSRPPAAEPEWEAEDEWEPDDYGDDPALDRLYDRCGAGDVDACDQLFYDSPAGSAYEEYGSTCGYTDCLTEDDWDDEVWPDEDW